MREGWKKENKKKKKDKRKRKRGRIYVREGQKRVKRKSRNSLKF